MVDPFAMTIATSVATKIADTLTDQAQQAFAAIVRRIRDKFRTDSAELGGIAALDAAITDGDAPAVDTLAVELGRLFTADPQFRDEIKELWDSVQPNGGVANVFYGKADKVIMMRDVQGDLTIN
jgi:hypothetical protein